MTGSIKTKTPKYKFIIPQFNIATWHDYIEDNFRAIDALFFNIFDIQNFNGSWTKTTEYKKDQVLFIGEDYEVDETGQLKRDDQGELIVSEYSGRMVKVLKDHTTDNSDYFSLYHFNHKDEYELFADASTAQKFANLAKQYSENAQQSENNAEIYKNNAQGYAQEAENSKNIAQQNAQLATNKAESAASSATVAKNSENSAASSATLAEGYKNNAKSFADSAKSSKDITVENVQTVTNLVQDPNLVTVGTDLRSASSNIKNVSSISEQTKNVSDNMSYIRSVDNNKENINKAVTNEANITTVAENINDIKTVKNNIDIIDNVAWNKSNINNVAENITSVNNVSENMADVKNAVQSANDAELWAVGTIEEKPEGSSKYWAEEAKNAAQVYDATETVKGIVRLATSDEVTVGTNDSAAITPLKFKQKIAQDLTNPSPDKIPSTKAVKDESSRIVSAMDTKVNKSGDTMNGRLINLHPIGPFTVRTSNYNNNISNDFYGSDLTIVSEDDINHIYFAGSNHPNNDIRARIVCNKIIDGKQTYSEIYAGLRADGTAYTSAPRCQKGNSIVTTISLSSGYVRFGNGVQICWGNSPVNQTITLPQAFKNNTYRVAFCQTDPSSHTYNNVAVEKTTTSFKFMNGYQGDWIAIGWWY